MHTRSVLSETVDQLIGRTLMPFSRRCADGSSHERGVRPQGLWELSHVSKLEGLNNPPTQEMNAMIEKDFLFATLRTMTVIHTVGATRCGLRDHRGIL